MLTARAFRQEVVQYVNEPYFENVEKLSVDRHDFRKVVNNSPFIGIPPPVRRAIIIEQVIFRHRYLRRRLCRHRSQRGQEALPCTSWEDIAGERRWPPNLWSGQFHSAWPDQLHAPAMIIGVAVAGARSSPKQPSLEHANVSVVFQGLPTTGTRHHRRRGAISFQTRERLRQSTLALRGIRQTWRPCSGATMKRAKTLKAKRNSDSRCSR